MGIEPGESTVTVKTGVTGAKEMGMTGQYKSSEESLCFGERRRFKTPWSPAGGGGVVLATWTVRGRGRCISCWPPPTPASLRGSCVVLGGSRVD